MTENGQYAYGDKDDPFQLLPDFMEYYEEMNNLLLEYESEGKGEENDGDDYEFSPHWTYYVMPVAILLLCFSILATITAALWKGAMRQYLIAKALAITLTIMARLATNTLLLFQVEKSELGLFGSSKGGVDGFTNEGNFGLYSILSLEKVTESLADAIGTIFLLELYQRTCQMKVVKDNNLKFFKQCGFALILSVILTSIQAFAAPFIAAKSTHVANASTVFPLNRALSVILTMLNIYLAFHIMKSFENSQEFRANAGSSNAKSKNILPNVLKITMTSCVGKLVFGILEITAITLITSSFYRCIEKQDRAEGEINHILECVSSYQMTMGPSYSIPYTWLSLLEYGCLFALKTFDTDAV